MTRTATTILLPALLLALASPAAAEDVPAASVAVQLSPDGLAFVGDEIPRHLPTRFSAPRTVQQLVNCPFTDNDTDLILDSVGVTVAVTSLRIIPQGSSLLVIVKASVAGGFDVDVTRPLACVGPTLSCHAGFAVSNARAYVTFRPRLRKGRVRLESPSVSLSVSKSRTSVAVSKCGFVGDLATLVLDKLKGMLVDIASSRLRALVLQQVVPEVEALLSDLTAVHQQLPELKLSAALRELSVSSNGLRLGAAFSLTPRVAPSCQLDPAPPPPQPPRTSALLGAHGEHLGLALSRTALERGVLASWRSGLLCLPHQQLERLGITAEVPPLSLMLLGLEGPAPLSLFARQAPQIALLPGDGARLTITVPQLEVRIDARADGKPQPIVVAVDAKLSVALRLDPASRSVRLDVLGVDLDQLQLVKSPWDISPKLLTVLLRGVVGALLTQQLSGQQVSPQVLASAGSGLELLEPYLLYIARAETIAEHVLLYVNLHRRAAYDDRAPQTSVLRPPPARTAQQLLQIAASGEDDETPTALLRYVWRIDGGSWSEPSYAPKRQLELPPGDHAIDVAAVDLHGNIDASPIRVAVTVAADGEIGKSDGYGTSDEDAGHDGGCSVARGDDGATAASLLLALIALARRRSSPGV